MLFFTIAECTAVLERRINLRGILLPLGSVCYDESEHVSIGQIELSQTIVLSICVHIAHAIIPRVHISAVAVKKTELPLKLIME